MISVKFFDIFKKKIGYDKRNEIFENGEDNAYPEMIDRLINNSVTAKMASDIMCQYLKGSGYGKVLDDTIINNDTKTTLRDFDTHVKNEIVKNRGVFIHVNYEIQENGTLTQTNPKVLPFDWCRIGKKDSLNYNGKIHVKSDWRNSRDEPVTFDVFNDNQTVLKAQIKATGGIEKYKGQVFYYNADIKYHYPLARVDSVIRDCDSEAQSAIYKNQLLRKGFFGKTLIVTRPLVDDNIPQEIEYEGKMIPNREYLEEVSEADDVQDNIEKFIGAENAGGCMMVTLDHAGEKLEDAILVKNIEANINPDMFRGVEASVRENILMTHCNLPAGLVKSSEGLFSTTGDDILEMKKTYWENTKNERDLATAIVNRFTKHIFETELVVLPLIEKKIIEPIEE